MVENKRLTFETEIGMSIERNEDCPTCSICWNCDIKVKDCKYFNDAIEKLAKYESIGTLEDFKILKSKEENFEVLEKEAYDRGYAQGIIQGRLDAKTMKENSDGCIGCAFVNVNSWEMPCEKCKRNAYDYWKSK